MFCKNCGKQLDPNKSFCSACGYGQQVQPEGAYASQPAPPPVWPSYQPVPQARPKKKRGCLISLIVALCVLALLVVCAGIFLPGLLWTRNLGVKTSEEAYLSAMQKMKYSKDDAPKTGAAEDYASIYDEPRLKDFTLSSEELTSFFNYNRPKYYAVKNVQILIHEDGTIEATGQVDVSYIFATVLENQYSREDAQKALPMLGLIPSQVNVYVKVDGGISNNAVSDLSIQQVSIMGVSIPQSLINSEAADSFIMSTANRMLQKVCDITGSSVDLLDTADGELRYKGTMPSSLIRRPNA